LIGTRSVHASEQLSRRLKDAGLGHSVLNAVRHQEEAHIVAEAGQPGHITVATNMAGRGTDIKLGRGVAELGGLHVICAEKNESGRIDRQLFGRCARQGDPGTTRSIVSFEDELVQRYAGRSARLASQFSRNSQTKRTASLPARNVFDRAQKQSQRLARRRRKEVMKTDHWLEEHLSFAADWS
jgi:preprotein translocase subunit SecA